MTFDDYLNLATTNAPFCIDPSWGQGRTTFGGLSAALLLHKAQQHTKAGDRLRSLSVSFCGPLKTELECELQVQPLRIGNSISHLQGQALQQGELVTLINACYGQSRISAIEITYPSLPSTTPGTGQRMPYIKGLTPEFTQHIDFSYVSGGLPFSGSKANHVHGWMRFKDVAGVLTNTHLIALIDAWPPAIIQKLKGPAPCATVAWNINFLNPLEEHSRTIMANEWLWYEVNINAAQHGYGHTSARIYSQEGAPLALSQQLVVAYDKV